MTWPTVAVDTTDTDADTDSPLAARQDILDAIQKLNQMIAHAVTYGGMATFTGVETLSNKVHTNPGNTDQTLTTAASLDWDMSLGGIASVTLNQAGHTFNAPTNMKKGTYILHVLQDGTGSRTITPWNAVFKWPSGTAPALSTGINKRDIITFICDGTNLYGAAVLDVR